METETIMNIKLSELEPLKTDYIGNNIDANELINGFDCIEILIEEQPHDEVYYIQVLDGLVLRFRIIQYPVLEFMQAYKLTNTCVIDFDLYVSNKVYDLVIESKKTFKSEDELNNFVIECYLKLKAENKIPPQYYS